MVTPDVDAAPTSDWVRAQELDYIISDVLEALDQVAAYWADRPVAHTATWKDHPALVAAHVRHLIEDGDQ